MKRFFLGPILLVVLFYSNVFYAQSFTPFTTAPFITIPGNNSNIDVLYNQILATGSIGDSFICWVNQLDSVYTLYLRQTGPDSGKNIVVFSDTGQIANPNIAFDYNNVRIAWQSYRNNHWQILSREFINDSLTGIVSITDSLEDNINPELNNVSIVWIQNGNLIFQYLDSVNTKPYILDTSNCSNPYVSKSINTYFNSIYGIIYEKGPIGSKQIFEANCTPSWNSSSVWSNSKVSKGGDNINPSLALIGPFYAYQEFENGVWKIVDNLFGNDTTENLSYDCENPVCFSYAQLIKISNLTTPFFVAYDLDSLKNNREIIIRYSTYAGTTINLSNADGDNYLPHISLFMSQNVPYIGIYWIHNQNGKEDIWMAYSKYYQELGAVNNPVKEANSFILNQNYPNPFNPSTVINYSIPKSSLVTIKVYDILGREVKTLVNGEKSAGDYSVQFSANNGYSSGVYFYRMQAGGFVQTKKLLLLK